MTARLFGPRAPGHIAVDLPWPPTVNTYWRHITIHGRARTVLSEGGRRFRQAALRRLFEHDKHHLRLPGPLSVSMRFYPPDRRKRDLDNLPKGVLDAMTHAGVWDDDSQIKRLELSMEDVDTTGLGLVCVDVDVL